MCGKWSCGLKFTMWFSQLLLLLQNSRSKVASFESLHGENALFCRCVSQNEYMHCKKTQADRLWCVTKLKELWLSTCSSRWDMGLNATSPTCAHVTWAFGLQCESVSDDRFGLQRLKTLSAEACWKKTFTSWHASQSRVATSADCICSWLTSTSAVSHLNRQHMRRLFVCK